MSQLTFSWSATAKMIDWWLGWAQEKENMSYKIWYPGENCAISQWPTEGASVYADPQHYWGKRRFPVEGLSVEVSRPRLDFVVPTELGFGQLPKDVAKLAVRVGLPNGLL